jgi:hypothetical protein
MATIWQSAKPQRATGRNPAWWAVVAWLFLAGCLAVGFPSWPSASPPSVPAEEKLPDAAIHDLAEGLAEIQAILDGKVIDLATERELYFPDLIRRFGNAVEIPTDFTAVDAACKTKYGKGVIGLARADEPVGFICLDPLDIAIKGLHKLCINKFGERYVFRRLEDLKLYCGEPTTGA